MESIIVTIIVGGVFGIIVAILDVFKGSNSSESETVNKINSSEEGIFQDDKLKSNKNH